jgi:hypothetical protein
MDTVAANGMANGAMSKALIQILTTQPDMSYIELLSKLRAILKDEQYEQVPQLCTGHAMDLDTQFFM